MKNLTLIVLLFVDFSLSAQETDGQSLENAPQIDPITAEVFADDIVVPNSPVQEPVEEPEAEQVHEAPSLDQTVPVAADEVPAEDDVDDSAAEDLLTVQLPPDATAEEELIYQYNRYRELMGNGVYDEADSVAKRVVELAIEVKGPRSIEFAKALTNLAIVQHRNEQFDAAQQNFQGAIEIIEDNEDRLDGQLINPLKGLGASQLDAGRPDLAGTTFRRAVHVTHVNEGPHNLDQVDILESLAESSLRLGSIEDARHIQEIISGLNERAHVGNMLALVPSLMRRASWQHRAGFIHDERITLRRAIRIIELNASKDDLQLVDPLTRLGQSFFYIDVSGTQSSYASQSISTGEIHFKRALRIASENPEANWEMIANTSLALGDYYMFQGNEQRARKVYVAAWQNLSAGEERLAYRKTALEQNVTLRETPLPQYISDPSTAAPTGQEVPLLQGNITIEYQVSARGRASNLKIVEAQPAAFTDMQRLVQREMRTRIYRPRFVDAVPTTTENQLLIHQFYYQQADLDALQEATAAADKDDS